MSRAPSALRWLHCLQQQFVQRERDLCSSHPADPITAPGLVVALGFSGFVPCSNISRGVPSVYGADRWKDEGTQGPDCFWGEVGLTYIQGEEEGKDSPSPAAANEVYMRSGD